uniref:Uncharacterized protein n=1 Tax=Panagrolaimus sp. JU765 TaxID=591449 RepID=A0AC34PZU2_9BILA
MLRQKTIWITVLLCSMITIIPTSVKTYTITQFDRQWIDSLRHTAMYYYNLDWARRQQYQVLLNNARSQLNHPYQQSSIFGSNYTVPANASYISKKQIFTRIRDIN